LLTKYFLQKDWKKEINKSNPLGTGGRLVQSYARLVSQLFSDAGSSRTVTPSEFRSTLREFAPQFTMNEQMDSLEFIEFLLSTIHEDLNHREKQYKIREAIVRDSPSQEEMEQWGDEAWAEHTARNDSIVVKLFHGMYKSATVCGRCHGVVVTFDPFQDVTVPLPKMYNPIL
jgi:ubiquitin C-terminal hydrolase